MKARRSREGKSVVLEVGPGEDNLLEGATPFSIKKILVPVDFSEASHKALLYGIRFAEAFKGTFQVVHVVEIPYGTGEAGVIVADAATMKTLELQARKQALDLVRKLGGATDNIEVLIRSGVAYNEIIQAAKEQRNDLIILSTHGRTGLKRLFMGSTAERVVRHAPCPVLVVREHEVDFLKET